MIFFKMLEFKANTFDYEEEIEEIIENGGRAKRTQYLFSLTTPLQGSH